MSESLIERLEKRAMIRRQIHSRKSVQEGKPDRLADLLEEAAEELRPAGERIIRFWHVIAVFFAMVALDIVFGLYVIRLAEAKAIEAALWAGAIQVANVFVVTSYVKDWRMSVPCVLGAVVGTWIAVIFS
jgi:hypothetical protein